MWSSVRKPGLGIMNALDSLVSQEADRSVFHIPDLHSSASLIATSDYSGQHKGSKFEVYTILITGSEGWHSWETARQAVRRAHRVGHRRISFKGLNDARKRDALPQFLLAADQLDGLCVTLIVSRSISSLFAKEGAIDFRSQELSPYKKYGSRVFERLLRVVHFVSFFLAGVSRDGQDVLWFTDQDDIAANEGRVIGLTHIWSNVFGHYLNHDLRHIKCGTTQCDNGTRQIEDLASIADLASGALGELFTQYASAGCMPNSELIVPVPERLTRKSRTICSWLACKGSNLRRMAFLFDRGHDGGPIQLKGLELHNIRAV